jgi:hypothetical protein
VDLKTPKPVSIMATCLSVSVTKGNTESGATGKVNFQLIPESAAELTSRLNSDSFDVTFAQEGLGDGYTIVGIRFRTDANGSAVAFMTLLAPESSMPALSLLLAHSRIGSNAKLVMESHQLAISDQLSRKADEDDGPCPFAGCTLRALHSGKHKLEEEPTPLRNRVVKAGDDLLPLN